MTTETFTAWAIDTRSKEGHGLVGRYWWFEERPPIIPSHLEGCRIALFITRALAREALLSVRRAWENPRVVGVKVTIEKQS